MNSSKRGLWLLTLAVLLFSCAGKKSNLPEASTKIPVAELKQFQFQPFAFSGHKEWLKPLDGSAERNSPGESQMELVPLAFLKEGNSVWLAGALKEGMFVRRSFLFHSNDGKTWKELEPASSALAIVAISTTKDKGLAAIESYYVEGSYLDGVWVLGAKNKWKRQVIARKQEWEKDVFRKDIKCCVESVLSFDATKKDWALKLEGVEDMADYTSRDFGKTWSTVKNSVRPMEVNRVLNETWKTVDWDGSVGLLEIHSDAAKMVLPKYWKFSSAKNKIYLKPILP